MGCLGSLFTGLGLLGITWEFAKIRSPHKDSKLWALVVRTHTERTPCRNNRVRGVDLLQWYEALGSGLLLDWLGIARRGDSTK